MRRAKIKCESKKCDAPGCKAEIPIDYPAEYCGTHQAELREGLIWRVQTSAIGQRDKERIVIALESVRIWDAETEKRLTEKIMALPHEGTWAEQKKNEKEYTCAECGDRVISRWPRTVCDREDCQVAHRKRTQKERYIKKKEAEEKRMEVLDDRKELASFREGRVNDCLPAGEQGSSGKKIRGGCSS